MKPFLLPVFCELKAADSAISDAGGEPRKSGLARELASRDVYANDAAKSIFFRKFVLSK